MVSISSPLWIWTKYLAILINRTQRSDTVPVSVLYFKNNCQLPPPPPWNPVAMQRGNPSSHMAKPKCKRTEVISQSTASIGLPRDGGILEVDLLAPVTDTCLFPNKHLNQFLKFHIYIKGKGEKRQGIHSSDIHRTPTTCQSLWRVLTLPFWCLWFVTKTDMKQPLQWSGILYRQRRIKKYNGVWEYQVISQALLHFVTWWRKVSASVRWPLRDSQTR